MLSAHGSAPEVVSQARQRGGYVVDAVCPLVTKVHHEVRVRAGKGFRVVYVGHEGHDEAVGTMAVAPESISLVSEPADVDALDDVEVPVAVLAQTTLSQRDWSEVAEAAKARFGNVWMPGRSDLCFATTNRPERARGDCRPLRRRRGDRLGELFEHDGPRQGGRGIGLRTRPAC